MFELDSRLNAINQYFKNTIDQYKLKISIINPHKINMINDVCILEISTGKYYCDLQIDIIDPNTKKRYGISEVMNQMGLLPGTKILDDNEIMMAKSILNELDNQLYAYGIITDRFLSKILQGDFSMFN